MDFVNGAGTISKRIDIARRISNAEIKYRKIILKTFGSAAPSSGKKPDPTREDDDKQVAKVMQECIAPRLERLRASYFGPHQPHPAADWWGVSWLFALWRGEPGVSIRLHERRLAKVEVMLNFVENHNSFDPEFWTRIAQWQLLKYQRDSRKLLEDFDKQVEQTGSVMPATKAYRSALANADERARAEALPSNVTWTDVFIVRHPSADPSIKAAIDLHRTSLDWRQKLLAKIDELLLQGPHFPPDCYALEFRTLVSD